LAYDAAYERTSNAGHAQRARRMHREALTGIGATGSGRAALVMNEALAIQESTLGTFSENPASGFLTALRHRRKKRRIARRIDKAVQLAREAVRLLPDGHHQRTVYQCNLSTILLRRHELTGWHEDVTEAARLARLSVDATRDNGVLHATALTALGRALQQEGRAPLDEVIAHWRAASIKTDARMEVRLLACRHWAEALMESDGDIAAALEPYTAAVELFSELSWAGSTADDSEHRMSNWPHLAVDAAACAIAARKPEHALELLERGRAVLWSQTLNLNTDLVELRDHDRETAKKLGRLLDDLRSTGSHDDVAHRATISAQVRELVKKIRREPQFADFLRPPSASAIRAAASEGPIVVVNASLWRCDALVVTPFSVEIVPLPGVDPAELARRTQHHLTSVLEGARTLELDLAELLDWLWQAVARPILNELGDTFSGRVWWCPTGLFAMLPLHAAQPRDGSPGLLDRVTSSYSPTVAALRHSRAPRTAKSASLVVVSVGDLPRQQLPGAKVEAAAVVSASSRPTEWLDSSGATPAAVRAALAQTAWSHFCCHGVVDLDKPSRSGLVLAAGELLTVAELRSGPTDGELAFLSACHTALTGISNSDEAITLTAAFQYAGWRQVVGTLWPLDDAVAVDLTTRFYKNLGHRPDGFPDAEAALHRSVMWLRDTHPDRPSLWANLIHCGA
jgi:hypothetical protein